MDVLNAAQAHGTTNFLPLPAAQPFLLEPALENLISTIKPSLQTVARSDIETLQRHRIEEEAETESTLRRENPVVWWKRDVRDAVGHSKMSLHNCKVRYEADQLLNLDEEGDVGKHGVDAFRSAALARDREVFWKLTVCLHR